MITSSANNNITAEKQPAFDNILDRKKYSSTTLGYQQNEFLLSLIIGFCDGIFSAPLHVFCPVYTVHGLIDGNLIPLVYGLLPDKTQVTHETFFSFFDQLGSKTVIDFEVTVPNAVKKV